MTYTCPKDPTHQSTDPDYCSECGAKIGGASPSSSATSSGPNSQRVPTAPGVGQGEICPDCGTPRTGTARYCEVCRYDFESSASHNPTSDPADAPPVAPPDLTPVDPVPVTPVIPNFATLKVDAVVIVDPSLYTNPDPAAPIPTNEPEHTFPLDLPENLIGRRSDSRGSYPEISIQDPGVSHRHAKLLMESDQVFLLELGSTNGTMLNGVDVAPGVKTPVNVGDQITLGCWTRIELRSRS